MRRLRAAAKRRGVSMAALVRKAIDLALSADKDDRMLLWERALEVRGFRDREGHSDVSIRHDEYLEEAFLNE